MNLPNKITIFRIILVPVFIFLIFSNWVYYNFLWALLVFILACVSDAIDGYIARKHNMITTFGKFLDPLADKILVISALIAFMELDISNSIVVIIIVSREFLVTSVRLVAVDKGIVIVASKLGKLKTVVHMVSICFILIFLTFSNFDFVFEYSTIYIISNIFLWICAIISLVSCFEYLYKNRNIINIKES